MIRHLDHFSNLSVLILILNKWTHKAPILKTQIIFFLPKPTTEATNDKFKGTILQDLK